MSDFDQKDVLLAVVSLGGLGAALWLSELHAAEFRRRSRLELLLAEQVLLCPCPPAVAPVEVERRPANGGASLALPQASAPRPRLASHAFDDVFARYGQGLPVAYLRALALHESDMTPRLSSGPAWGLLQVIEVVRHDFNQRAGTNYSRQDLLDPAVNVTIAASTLAQIVKSYATNHAHIPNLQADWRNPQFVALLTFGWNAGYSERGGVGRVATYLEQRGVSEITLDGVFAAAPKAGASRHLSSAPKLAWSKQVTRQYFAELAGETKLEPREIEMPEEYVGRPISVAEQVSPPFRYDESGPITSPSQVEHEALVPLRSAGVTSPGATHPSGGAGPIDPYDSSTNAHDHPCAFEVEHHA